MSTYWSMICSSWNVRSNVSYYLLDAVEGIQQPNPSRPSRRTRCDSPANGDNPVRNLQSLHCSSLHSAPRSRHRVSPKLCDGEHSWRIWLGLSIVAVTASLSLVEPCSRICFCRTTRASWEVCGRDEHVFRRLRKRGSCPRKE